MISQSLINFFFLHDFLDASHLRDIFYRMGLSDQDIVALSGGHTLVYFVSLCRSKVDRFPYFFINFLFGSKLGSL